MTTPAMAAESSSQPVYALLIMIGVSLLAIVILCLVSLGFVMKGKTTSHHMKQFMRDIENGAEPLVVTANNHEMKVLLRNSDISYYESETRNYANESRDSQYDYANSDTNCDVGSEYLYHPGQTMTRGTEMSEDSLSCLPEGNIRSQQKTNRVRHSSVCTQTSDEDLLEAGHQNENSKPAKSRKTITEDQERRKPIEAAVDIVTIQTDCPKLDLRKAYMDSYNDASDTYLGEKEQNKAVHYGIQGTSNTERGANCDDQNIEIVATLTRSAAPDIVQHCEHAIGNTTPIDNVPADYDNRSTEHIYTSINDAPLNDTYYENTQEMPKGHGPISPSNDNLNQLQSKSSGFPQLQSKPETKQDPFPQLSISHVEKEVPQFLSRNGPCTETTPKCSPNLHMKSDTTFSESQAEDRGNFLFFFNFSKNTLYLYLTNHIN